MYIYRQRLQTTTPLPFPSSWFSRSSSFIPDLSFILHSLYYSRCPFLVVDSRFSFLILHSLYSRPAVPMLCVPSKMDVSPWPFLWSVNLIVSEMKKADLRMGRKRNLSRQKDSEISTFQRILQSQNAFTPRIPYSRLKLLVIVNAPLIDRPRIRCSKRTGRNCCVFRLWRAHLDKMTAQEQMKKMLDELMGTQRDGE